MWKGQFAKKSQICQEIKPVLNALKGISIPTPIGP